MHTTGKVLFRPRLNWSSRKNTIYASDGPIYRAVTNEARGSRFMLAKFNEGCILDKTSSLFLALAVKMY